MVVNIDTAEGRHFGLQDKFDPNRGCGKRSAASVAPELSMDMHELCMYADSTNRSYFLVMPGSRLRHACQLSSCRNCVPALALWAKRRNYTGANTIEMQHTERVAVLASHFAESASVGAADGGVSRMDAAAMNPAASGASALPERLSDESTWNVYRYSWRPSSCFAISATAVS